MQDGKNLILAIVLCLLVVVGWSYLGEKMGWAPKPVPVEQTQNPEAAAQAQAQQAAQTPQAPAAPLPVFTESEGRDMTIVTPLYTARLYTGGGILRSFELANYRTAVEADSPKVNLINETTAAMAPMGLLLNGQPTWSVGKWQCEEQGDVTVAEGTQKTIRLIGMVGDLRVVRELTFDAASYAIKENVHVTPVGTQALSVRLGYTAGADASNAHGDRYDAMRVGWDEAGSLEEESSADKLATGVTKTGTIYWAGAMSTYFFNGVLPAKPENVTFKGVLQNQVYRVAIELEPFNAIPGQESVVSTTYWMGPKDRHLMAPVSEELTKCIDLGMFSLIAKGLLWILNFFYGYVHNWGVAIILLTIVIKIIFWPLTAKSYSSMEKMKQLAPMMQQIREKHKGDKEATNKEVMALYKTYGVNPASGCIPILIQMPVFLGLYQALLTAIELRHAPLLATLPGTDIAWLADLSSKDPLYITPIVMGLSMFIQQRLSPPATDARQQKIMMLLPVVFTFLFLAFPSGLVVYWLVNNIISIGQQRWMMHKMGTDKKNHNKKDKGPKGQLRKPASSKPAASKPAPAAATGPKNA